jgi:hypothetical protein
LILKGKGIITSLQRKILYIFSTLPDNKYFYLTGGTALAEFYLAHRKSYDLDLFTTEQKLILPFSYLFEKELRKHLDIKIVRRFETYVEFEILDKNENTKVQFALDSPFRFEEPLDSEIGIKVNDYKDLIVDKLLAFFGRTEPRDVIDLYFILQKEDFWTLTDLAKQKDPGFDLYWMAIALHKVKEYPDDLIDWPVDMIKEINIKEMKKLFLKLSNEILNKLKNNKPLHHT